MTRGRSAASSVVTDMEHRVTSPRRRTTISRITSFTSTNFRCGGIFLKSSLTRSMISARQQIRDKSEAALQCGRRWGERVLLPEVRDYFIAVSHECIGTR